ncbi:MAG: hypothetical protein NXI20_22890 [bacterium]|jgi:hypothetical protein|nr:hypothetical protein [bacterium]
MKLQDKLDYCRVCENRKTDYERGIVCGLTDDKPTWEDSCPDFIIDEVNADRLADRDPKVKKILKEAFVEKKPKKGFFGRFRK